MRRNSLRSALIRFKGFLSSSFKKISGLIRDTSKLKAFYEELKKEKNRRSLKLLLGEIKTLLRESKPKKGSGYLILGLSDPYETGKAMEAAALLYPFWGDFFEVSPDFEEERVEGKLEAKGRIRLFVVLRSLFKLYRDKNLMRIIKMFVA
ncbi:MAG: hypothetical protein ACOYBV_02825 [Candidatus Avilachnospira sp.]